MLVLDPNDNKGLIISDKDQVVVCKMNMRANSIVQLLPVLISQLLNNIGFCVRLLSVRFGSVRFEL